MSKTHLFTEIVPNIYRLTVPFEDLYTTVYLCVCEGGTAIVDCATTAYDVENIIVPALRVLNAKPDVLLLTHCHGDHAGGSRALTAAFPEMKVYSAAPVHMGKYLGKPVETLTDSTVFFDRIRAIALIGPSRDAFGFLDTVSNTLLAGDCLQQYGIGRFGVGLADKDGYLSSIEKIRAMNPTRIICAHDYAPHGHRAEGDKEIEALLDTCRRYVLEKAQK